MNGNICQEKYQQFLPPEFDVDEEGLVIGVKMMSNVLLDYLDR